MNPQYRNTAYPLLSSLFAAVCFCSLELDVRGEPPSLRTGKTLFTELHRAETGIDFVNPLLPDHALSYLYPFGYACGGVSIGDLDGDDRLDIFCVGGPKSNGLFLQDSRRALRFKRATASGTEGGDAWGTGAALVDIDGDGDLDIHVCNYDRTNQLFINYSTPGNPKFKDEAAAYGLDIRDASIMATFADVDNDGDLDAYVMCNRYVPPKGLPSEAPGKYDAQTDSVVMFSKYERYFRAWKQPDGNFEADSYGRNDYLLINTGPNASGQVNFKDVTSEAGIEGAGHALSATWIDFDRDGMVDLHVANDFEDPDRFYRNLGPDADGIVRFQNVIADVLPYTSWSSMGADVGDLDGDGLLDLMVADMSATTHFKSKINMGEMGGRKRWVLENDWPRQAMRNMLFLNTGRAVFREAAFMAGLGSSDWTWAVKLADFDHDGLPDVFLTNGMSRNYTDSDIPFSGQQRYGQTQWDHFRDKQPLAEQNMAFRNTGNLSFDNSSQQWGLDKVGMSYSCAYGDLDGDGDLDLVVANLDEPVSIYRNETTGNWLNVRLQGRGDNHFGVGAIVRLTTQSHGTLTRMANPWTGWASTNGHDLHFGLHQDASVEGIEVVWPGNKVQRIGATTANRLITIKEAEAFEDQPTSQPGDFVVAPETAGPNFVHHENNFDDYKDQPLLPGKLSAFGPCMSWGDANGDGRPDVYFGGARGQEGELWINSGGGQFSKAKIEAFEDDSICEDADACWLDVEGDGDLDLVVASGSTEKPQGNPTLFNRLYVNLGLSKDGSFPLFQRAPDTALARLAYSSSVIAPADFDLDGDTDLFIGSRSVPGQYPITPESHLLINETDGDDIRFALVTDQAAQAIGHSGLVTGAEWVDVDGDGWQDLVVSNEWGFVRLWLNQNGKLTEVTEPAGLATIKGWWYGLCAADVDADGDVDLIALNAGLNTKYGRATPDHPALLYYGHMDGSGEPRLIEAKSKEGDLLPVRGRSCSSRAMPFVGEMFGTFRDFALADLQTIYTPQCLDDSLKLEANGFESGVWINESKPGKPSFEFRPFPRIAQISSSYDAAVADFNRDGHVDIFLAQNHYHREPETGLWRGGVGQLLYGRGDGKFDAASVIESGIILRGDSTSSRAVDIDGDGDKDIIATQNNDRVQVFLNQRLKADEIVTP